MVCLIRDEIERTGPMTFAHFMDLALYHPTYGYYTRLSSDPDHEDIGERIGWNGDYYTSSDVHGAIGWALAKQLAQMDEVLGHPSPFTVVEMGAGKGLLARDILTCWSERYKDLFARGSYVLVDRSPVHRRVQQENLAEWVSVPGKVVWAEDLTSLGEESVTGVLLSNELVDAFPVHRVRMRQGRLEELYVSLSQDRFQETPGPLSTPALSDYFSRAGITLPEDACAEVNLVAVSWMREIARVLGRGYVITIDYGHAAHDLYGPDRRQGTLLGYYRHMIAENPLIRVGEQDLTSHVDFTTLAQVGREAGLDLTGFTNQMSFLISLGVESFLESLEPGSPEFQAIVQLLRPEGMGRTFKLLIQQKGVEATSGQRLEGLNHQPFFGSILQPSIGFGGAIAR
ncbi:MAG: SAM-dependent methyltransferase [Nitrospiraceae bacterium]